jgi:hypothetical protein
LDLDFVLIWILSDKHFNVIILNEIIYSTMGSISSERRVSYVRVRGAIYIPLIKINGYD